MSRGQRPAVVKGREVETDGTIDIETPSRRCPLCGSRLHAELRISLSAAPNVNRGPYIDCYLKLTCFGPRYEKHGCGSVNCRYFERFKFGKDHVPIERIDDMDDVVRFLFAKALPKETWTAAKTKIGQGRR